jgi:ribonuclease HI
MPPQGTDTFTWYRNMGKKHGLLFFVTIWVVWCSRNDVIFNNSNENIHTSLAKIFSLLKSCEAAFSSPPTTSNNSATPRSVAWSRPVEGSVCLNVDGSLLVSTNTAGYGGLLRDNNGVFLLGFYGAATAPSILFAELMAILHGLQICWESGYRRISCFSDSLQAVNLIWDGVSAHHRFANEVVSIRQLLDRNWEIVVEHTLREGNACADVLAKMGALSDSPLVKISSPPVDLAIPLLADAQGVVFFRE